MIRAFFKSLKMEATKNPESSNMVSSIISTAGNLVSGFNYKAQQNEIELARVHADAAQANAETQATNNNKRFLIIGGVVVVAIVIILLLKPNK